MTTIKAVVRNGRIEVHDPIDLPDGTELSIPIPGPGQPHHVQREEVPDAPDVIEEWIRWYDALEPLEFTPEERAAWDAARREQKEFELSQWESRSRRIEERFS
jgi:hypothetical protein